MIKKYYSDIDVVTAAKERIKNIFSSAPKVYLNVSGGKDSLVLHDITFKMCQSGIIDKSKLTVTFIDEEAIYPCCESLVKTMRLQWISLGVPFQWWCIECRHHNCFNMLTNDESFICWDRYKKDVWVRQKPSFALTTHPLLIERQDTYQDFLARLHKDGVAISGVRVSESVQRRNYMGQTKNHAKLFPIYDFTDTDIWRYIRDNNLEIPDAYMFLYQTGAGKNQMRLSQFFSVDTARSLVNMCEYYPNLFEKICKREPNAYMAMLYFDTEMFRRKKRSMQTQDDKDINYKAKTLELLNNDAYFVSDTAKKVQKTYIQFVIRKSALLSEKNYKRIYYALVGGDPKLRELRAIGTDIVSDVYKES